MTDLHRSAGTDLAVVPPGDPAARPVRPAGVLRTAMRMWRTRVGALLLLVVGSAQRSAPTPKTFFSALLPSAWAVLCAGVKHVASQWWDLATDVRSCSSSPLVVLATEKFRITKCMQFKTPEHGLTWAPSSRHS